MSDEEEDPPSGHDDSASFSEAEGEDVSSEEEESDGEDSDWKPPSRTERRGLGKGTGRPEAKRHKNGASTEVVISKGSKARLLPVPGVKKLSKHCHGCHKPYPKGCEVMRCTNVRATKKVRKM